MRPTPPGRATRVRAAVLTLYAHPFELAVGVVLGVSAIRLAVQRSDVLELSLVAGWAVLNALGIAAVVGGLFGSADLTGTQPKRRAFFRAIEKAGLYVLAGTTAAYGVLLEARLPLSEAWATDIQLGAIAVACVLRALAVRKAERITLEELRKAAASAEVAAVVADVLRARGPVDE